MNVVRKYDIAYKGLSEGKHEFGFAMDDGFFSAFGNPDILGGHATANVILEKLPASLKLDFDIRGEVAVECDRCLEECRLPVDYSGRLAVKFTDEKLDPAEAYDGEVMWLSHGDSILNVAQYIYESIVLSLPYQRVHPDKTDGTSGCNPEMLERFRIVSEDEFQRLTTPEQATLEENPEFEKLRKLKEQM